MLVANEEDIWWGIVAVFFCMFKTIVAGIVYFCGFDIHDKGSPSRRVQIEARESWYWMPDENSNRVWTSFVQNIMMIYTKLGPLQPVISHCLTINFISIPPAKSSQDRLLQVRHLILQYTLASASQQMLPGLPNDLLCARSAHSILLRVPKLMPYLPQVPGQ